MIRKILETINEASSTPEKLYRDLERAGWEVSDESIGASYSSRIWEGPYHPIHIRTVEIHGHVQEVYVIFVPQELELERGGSPTWEMTGHEIVRGIHDDIDMNSRTIFTTVRELAQELGL